MIIPVVGKINIDSNAAVQALPTAPGGSLYRLSVVLSAPPSTALGESALLNVNYTAPNGTPQGFEVGPITVGQFDQTIQVILTKPDTPVTCVVTADSALLLTKFNYSIIVEQL